ncbi:MAG TPA: hypothetical protein G4N92_09995 [Anaerolineae bacterium]|nr:hypothetical protein [Anaerolineae bacterium]
MRLIEEFFDLIFNKSPLSSTARFYILVFILFIIWMTLALSLHPPVTIPESHFLLRFLPYTHDPIIDLLFRVTAAFFSFDVIIRVAAIFITFFIAKKYTAAYMSLIYSLPKTKDADNFLANSIVPIQNYPTIIIRKSDIVKNFSDSILFKIGGPGKIIIGIENAIFFESNNGAIELIGPTINQLHHYYFLQWFKQLREIIDLRDQSINLFIQGRTKNGILLNLKDVNFIFSLVQEIKNKKSGSSSTINFKFLEKIYREIGYSNWVDFIIDNIYDLIIGFLRKHTLEELLSKSDQQETFTKVQREKYLHYIIQQQKTYVSHIVHKTKPPINHLKRLGKKKKSKGLRKHPKQTHQTMRFIQNNLLLPEELKPISNINFINSIINQFKEEYKGSINNLGIRLEKMNIDTWESPYLSISNNLHGKSSPFFKKVIDFNVQKNREIQAQAKNKEILEFIRNISRNIEIQIHEDNQNLNQKDLTPLIVRAFIFQLIKLKNNALKYGLRIPTGFTKLMNQLQSRSN